VRPSPDARTRARGASLPTPRPGQVLGLVGTNGIGKSTALKILAGKLKPNLGRFDAPPDWQEILAHFRGSELQNFLTRILEDNIKAIIKPQYVDAIPKAVTGNVGTVLDAKNERGVRDELLEALDLVGLTDRTVSQLSGGELQRFAIAVVAAQRADIYMFDEPSSYLDVKQRLKAGRVIRSLLGPESYVVVVEHDLSVLDYLSDFICCLYGKPGAYGVVTLPFSVREGINIFLAGFVPTENLRFRDEEISFKVAEVDRGADDDAGKKFSRYKYPACTKTMGDFKLNVERGDFTDSEIVVMLGENGTGKTTFIRLLAGLLPPDVDPDAGEPVHLPEFNVSYKPQKISPKFESTVRNLLHKKIRDAYLHPQFISDVLKPMRIEELMDQEVQNLSGGELQRVAITLCLGTPADIYLIDEPSAYLDSEQRIVASKVIKRFILHAKKTAFVVEHDFIMATYLADRVIVYEGTPGVDATARTPQSLLSGMNLFLKNLDITFRRDPTNYRPRINKYASTKDQEQKLAGSYYFLVRAPAAAAAAAPGSTLRRQQRQRRLCTLCATDWLLPCAAPRAGRCALSVEGRGSVGRRVRAHAAQRAGRERAILGDR
jgi:ATP-binding cassette subfamily E protein 1